MRYSVVTPTICRPSLARLCASVDIQTQPDWEHLVVIDVPRDQMSREQQKVLSSITSKQNRTFAYCDKKHNNYGHTCRHQIWERAKGDYILYVDDDDYLADENVLKTLDSVTAPWAVFPMLRHGQFFLGLPPGICKTGTGMFIHKREIGRWPNTNEYEADGAFVEELKRGYCYQVVDSAPLVVQPKSSCGVSNPESWFGDKRASLIRRWVQYRYLAKTLITRTVMPGKQNDV
jgi:glycosyltransferase involved in cell wall biosynthesis